MTPNRIAQIRDHQEQRKKAYNPAYVLPPAIREIDELLAEVDRLAQVERVWADHRDAEDGSMTWRLVRDMDSALAFDSTDRVCDESAVLEHEVASDMAFCAVCHAAIYQVRRGESLPFWRHEPRSPIVGAHVAAPEVTTHA